MSRETRKIEYKCACGKNYGSCGETGKFFMRYEGVSDTYILLWQPHPTDALQLLGYFDDHSLYPLAKLINDFDESERVTDEERDAINEKLKF